MSDLWPWQPAPTEKPKSSLDDTLEKIVDELAYFDIGDDDFIGGPEYVERIKQAFIDEGYEQPEITRKQLYESYKTVIDNELKQGGYMLGQEWYDRFEKYTREDMETGSGGTDLMWAAKKAAGLE